MFFFFKEEAGIGYEGVTGFQTCALPIFRIQRGGAAHWNAEPPRCIRKQRASSALASKSLSLAQTVLHRGLPAALQKGPRLPFHRARSGKEPRQSGRPPRGQRSAGTVRGARRAQAPRCPESPS